jgi:hypothetical protein
MVTSSTKVKEKTAKLQAKSSVLSVLYITIVDQESEEASLMTLLPPAINIHKPPSKNFNETQYYSKANNILM